MGRSGGRVDLDKDGRERKGGVCEKGRVLGCKLRTDCSALGLLQMRMRSQPRLGMGGFLIHVALGSLSDW